MREGHGQKTHDCESNRCDHVEQTKAHTEEMRHWFPEQSQVADSQKNSQFRWTETPEGDSEFTQRMRREIRLNREHQKRNQQADGDPRMHVSRQCEPAHQGKGAETIDHVVDIESVAWTLTLAHPRERAIERV